MKTFTVIEKIPVTGQRIYTYHVEAETEEEAIHKVMNEEIDIFEAEFEEQIENDWDAVMYEVKNK